MAVGLYMRVCVLIGIHSQIDITASQSTLTPAGINKPCIDSVMSSAYRDVIYVGSDESCGHNSCPGWYNTTMIGGWRQMATFDNLPGHCWQGSICARTLVIALTENHPDLSTVDETIQTLSACAVNDTSKECVFDVDIMMRKCGNDLTYYLSHVDSGNSNWDIAYGFERIYNHPCEDPVYPVQYMYLHESEGLAVVVFNAYGYILWNDGWLNASFNGQQYFIPTVGDFPYVDRNISEFDRYWSTSDHYWLPAIEGDRNYWKHLTESATRLSVCFAYTLEDNSKFKCDYKAYDIYASKCYDGIRYQIETSMTSYLVAVSSTYFYKPIVTPTVRHKSVIAMFDGTWKKAYEPVLQFRCSFPMEENVLYTINWYIDGILVVRQGPSRNQNKLMIDESHITSPGLGFNIKCGYQVNEETRETISRNFFAGIKILDPDIKLSRRGAAIVRVQLTVPVVCLYPTSDETTCSLNMTLYDPHTNVDECSGALSISVEHGGRCSEEIKALKRGETWDPHTIYAFMVTTVDHTYDDKTDYNLRFVVSGSDSHSIWNGYQQDGVKVQESTRYCFGDSGPVCACGIAVRAGQDVFMIDRCSNVNYLDFLYCGDGGILDVEVENDYQYTVTTPIGTKVIIYTWRNFLNTKIIMSAKDFGNTEGLCGYFDGDWENDFMLSDGSFTDSDHYVFAKSWRLSDEMNLFKNSDRELEKWSENNNVSCQCSTDGCRVGQYTGCQTPISITKTKCQRHNNKPQTGTDVVENEDIQKRSVDEVISNSTAIKMCNDSVYNSPSVKYFSDMLNGAEDPSEVVKQCVFDVLASNDPSLTTMYVNEINNVVINFIELNPVYAANNTQTVEQFLLESCLNDCSDKGECLVTGQCSCRGFYRGPDCSIDIRIPPTIQDIHDGGECDRASGELCECFIVRTDNLFEGFMFQLHTTRVYFDGDHEPIGYSVHTGNHEDIFTGTVCVPNTRSKRDDQQISDYVILYDVALSNDGDTFGTAMSVLAYDSTCHNVVNNDTLIAVSLKEGYCYISGTCIPDGTEDGCKLCNSNDLPFNWSLDSCDDQAGLSKAALIGIIVGSAVLALVGIAILVYMLLYRPRNNRVQSVTDLTSFDGNNQPISYNLHFTSKR